jgi:hypothetical protein
MRSNAFLATVRAAADVKTRHDNHRIVGDREEQPVSEFPPDDRLGVRPLRRGPTLLSASLRKSRTRFWAFRYRESFVSQRDRHAVRVMSSDQMASCCG